MLSKPDAQVAYENGVAVGVTADGETAKAKLVVGDPSYFPDKVSRTSRVSVALQLHVLVIPHLRARQISHLDAAAPAGSPPLHGSAHSGLLCGCLIRW